MAQIIKVEIKLLPIIGAIITSKAMQANVHNATQIAVASLLSIICSYILSIKLFLKTYQHCEWIPRK
jgi:uncharacterized protein YqgC (DUF456 family)